MVLGVIVSSSGLGYTQRVSRVIVVANQKGGVGKTTTVANLGAALAKRGYRVLLFDFDPQAALTAWAGLDPYHLSPTTYSLMMKEDISLKGIARSVNGQLLIAPAGVDLAAVEYTLTSASDRNFRLRDRINNGRDDVDYLLIDTPPNLGLITTNALVAADELLIPVQCHYLAMRGVRALLEAVWLIHDRLHPDLKLLGLLPTMFEPESKHAQGVVRELRAVFGQKVFENVIHMDDALAVAPAARRSVIDYRPDSKAAGDFQRLAEEIIRGES